MKDVIYENELSALSLFLNSHSEKNKLTAITKGAFRTLQKIYDEAFLGK